MAKEFDLPIEEVMEWPITKTMEHFYFLKEWYKIRYGDSEDVDMPSGSPSKSIPSTPKIPSKVKKHMPSKAKTQMDAMQKQGKSLRSGHGASGHKYKFKKIDD